MQIYKCGTEVTFNSLIGKITAINIRIDVAQYEVSYFLGGEYKAIWLYEFEFETDVPKQQIGFKK